MHQGAKLREREQDKENDVWGPVGKRGEEDEKGAEGRKGIQYYLRLSPLSLAMWVVRVKCYKNTVACHMRWVEVAHCLGTLEEGTPTVKVQRSSSYM